jgi:DNA-binding NarL/FixJ family response regulator
MVMNHVSSPDISDALDPDPVSATTVASGLASVKGDCVETFSVGVLVVEDHEPFRRFLCSALENRPGFQTVCEASDGLEAVRKAEERHPDLILLDVGLPSLNGIEAARRIRKLSPKSKILFVSQESSVDLVHAAIAAGAKGYVLKMDAGKELLQAVDVVLQGGQFLGRRFSGHHSVGASDATASPESPTNVSFIPLHEDLEIGLARDAGF